MAEHAAPIHVNPDTNISDVLAAASHAPVLLQKDDVVYRISREPEDLWTGYDPAAVRAALRKHAHLMTPEEGKERIAAIYRAREEGSRPAETP